jgi:hypothetical protein
MASVSLLQRIVQHFEHIQWGFLALVGAAVFIYLFQRKPVSNFKVREADREDLDALLEKGKDLGSSRLKRKSPPPPPLSLPGIRLSGEPHEILGIRADASETEILRAYKEAIKRFHPDTIQGPAKDQLEFYQKASAAINNAKNWMIKNLRSR